MGFDCPYCGVELEDPGDGFIAHLRDTPACLEPWEHHAEAAADEASRH